MLTYIIIFAVGVLIGCLTSKLLLKTKYAGTLLMYKPNDNEPVSFYVELNNQPEVLYDCDYVNFEVKRIKT